MAKELKVNEKYGVYGLTKEEDVTMFEGFGIDDYPSTARDFLANYGMFALFTRSHAAPKDAPLTEKEKKDRFNEMHQWLSDGCPKRTKSAGVKVSPYDDAIAKVNASTMPDLDKKAAIKMLNMVYGKA
jgi:hypothetical protein